MNKEMKYIRTTGRIKDGSALRGIKLETLQEIQRQLNKQNMRDLSAYSDRQIRDYFAVYGVRVSNYRDLPYLNSAVSKQIDLLNRERKEEEKSEKEEIELMTKKDGSLIEKIVTAAAIASGIILLATGEAPNLIKWAEKVYHQITAIEQPVEKTSQDR